MMLVRVYWSMLEYIDKPGMAWLQVAQKDQKEELERRWVQLNPGGLAHLKKHPKEMRIAKGFQESWLWCVQATWDSNNAFLSYSKVN